MMKQFVKFIIGSIAVMFTLSSLSACEKNKSTWDPSMLNEGRPDLPELDGKIHTYKAPMYWSVYEYCREAEKNTNVAIDMASHEWDRIIDWVATNLLPYGYDMIVTDGFMAMLSDNSEQSKGYMTHYGSSKLTDLIAKCKAKGLKFGVYDNPLWIHGDDNMYVDGTGYKLGSLRYNSSDKVLKPGSEDAFPWAVPSHKGCKEFIDGFFKYYKSIGVEYIRMDFMCLFETADGAGGMPGKGYGREEYELALKYICESAQRYGVFTSIVMPTLKVIDGQVLELAKCNEFRFSADTFDGGWGHVSSWCQGEFRPGFWPSTSNIFDGYIIWSQYTGADTAIPDGDFIRLNTMETIYEGMTEITLHLMAGGPLQAADRPEMLTGDKDWLWLYQNEEVLALNKDHFIGKPLSTNVWDERSQIWFGTMSDGSHILALFNRSDNDRTCGIAFSELGLEGEWQVRDLWGRIDEGSKSFISETVPKHGVKLVRLSR